MKKDIRFRFNWVLINELAVGTVPNNKDNLKLLKDKGINSVLSLCSTKEAPSIINLNKFFVHENFVLPDHSYSYEMRNEDILFAIEILSKLMKNGPVFVHCLAAMERSPLITMAWLIKTKGLTTEQALDYLMQVNPGTSPMQIQLDVLNKSSKFLMNKFNS